MPRHQPCLCPQLAPALPSCSTEFLNDFLKLESSRPAIRKQPSPHHTSRGSCFLNSRAALGCRAGPQGATRGRSFLTWVEARAPRQRSPEKLLMRSEWPHMLSNFSLPPPALQAHTVYTAPAARAAKSQPLPRAPQQQTWPGICMGPKFCSSGSSAVPSTPATRLPPLPDIPLPTCFPSPSLWSDGACCEDSGCPSRGLSQPSCISTCPSGLSPWKPCEQPPSEMTSCSVHTGWAHSRDTAILRT